jgi:arylsulfatase A-like enzyme
MVEPEKWQQMNAHLTDPGQRLRAACASHLDDAIGQVLTVLQRKNFRDNTLVIFLSDNGAHPPGDNQGGPYPGEYARVKVGNDNAPLRGHKTQVYEGGIRTPGVVHWPGKVKPGAVDTPLHAVDWMPTLCALAGAQCGAELKWDGMNIWPVLAREQTQFPPRTLYSAAPAFRAQMVRHGDWKLVVTKGTGKKETTYELFDLASDLGETKNLAAEEPEVLTEMKQRLAEISARDKDAVAND